MSELFRPSNGTEGMCFEARFCDRCIHDREQSCAIHNAAMLYVETDAEYPREWVYDAEGEPVCTAFATEILPPSRVELEAAGQARLIV